MGVGGSELKGVISVSAGEAFAEAYAAASAGVSGNLVKCKNVPAEKTPGTCQAVLRRGPSVTNAGGAYLAGRPIGGCRKANEEEPVAARAGRHHRSRVEPSCASTV